MGEIVDMMMDGTLCQVCGGVLEGGPLGYPKSCGDCEVNAPEPPNCPPLHKPMVETCFEVKIRKGGELFPRGGRYLKRQKARKFCRKIWESSKPHSGFVIVHPNGYPEEFVWEGVTDSQSESS